MASDQCARPIQYCYATEFEFHVYLSTTRTLSRHLGFCYINSMKYVSMIFNLLGDVNDCIVYYCILPIVKLTLWIEFDWIKYDRACCFWHKQHHAEIVMKIFGPNMKYYFTLWIRLKFYHHRLIEHLIDMSVLPQTLRDVEAPASLWNMILHTGVLLPQIFKFVIRMIYFMS